MNYWPTEFLLRCGLRRGPVLRARLGATRYVYLLSPEANRLVFAHDEWFSVHEAMKGLVAVDGPTSVVVSDGADHARRRELLRPALAPRSIGQFLEAMHLSATEAVESLPAGVRVDVYPVLRRAIRRSTIRCLFGPTATHDADALGAELQPLLDLVDHLPQVIDLHRRLNSPLWRRATHARARLDAHVDRLVHTVKAPDEADSTGLLGEPTSLLELLIHGRDGEGSGLSAQEVRDQVVTLIAAGYETTSAAAGWAVHCLATHPHWQEHARAEAAAIAAQPDPALVKGLSVLPAIVQETLRLYPPATISARRTEQPFTIHGVNVSVGDMVIFSPYATHRDPRVYAEPTRFDPARWLDGARPDPGTYLPWGGGAHRCLGSHMATTELVIMLAHLITAGPFQTAGRRPRAHGFAAMRPNHATIIRTQTDNSATATLRRSRH